MATQLTPRVFGPGWPATGRVVVARFEAGQVVLEPDGARVTLPLAGASIGAAGFDGRQWGIDIVDGDARWRLQLEDEASIAALRDAPPPALADAVAARLASARRGRGLRALGLGALALWIAGPLLLVLALLLLAGPLSAFAVSHVPVDVEERLGDRLFAAYRGRLDLVDDGPAVDLVRSLGERLSAASAYEYDWYVTRDPAINAFAMPGGTVVVNTGLIGAATRAEELAGVLAHEIQHVEQRHSLRALAHSAGIRIALALWLGELAIGADIAGRLASLDFSRDAEREADRLAIDTLIAAGIDPRGLADMFATMQLQAGATPPAWLSTHPASDERIATLRAAVADAPVPAPIAVDWPAVQDSLQPAPSSVR